MNSSNYTCTDNSTFFCLVYQSTVTKTIITGKSPLISNEVKVIFEYIVQIGLFYVTSVFGVTANIINIIVYKTQGLKDSITLGFFVLSISDLFVAGLPLETATCYALNVIYPDSHVDFNSIHYMNSAWLRRMFYSFSCSVTALLSIERCLCVILPFKVKLIFTRSRTVTIVASIALLHLLCFVPIFATHQLRWQRTSSRNHSKILRVWFAPHRDVIEDVNAISTSILLPTLAQIIVTCCATVMVHGLRKASTFRQAVTSHRKPENTKPSLVSTTNTNSVTRSKVTTQGDACLNGSARQENKVEQEGSERVTLSLRDARLVRTMVYVVAILSACNIPNLVMIYAILAVPALNIHQAYHNTFSIVFSVNYLLTSVNAILNILVYYNTSTKYREVFQQVFSLVKK